MLCSCLPLALHSVSSRDSRGMFRAGSVLPRPRRRYPASRVVRRVALADGEAVVATVFDLFVANYGLDRGFGGENVASSFDDGTPYTPAWAEKITGTPSGTSSNSSTKTAPWASRDSTTKRLCTIS